jgi:hypothetical protein
MGRRGGRTRCFDKRVLPSFAFGPYPGYILKLDNDVATSIELRMRVRRNDAGRVVLLTFR